MLFRSLQGFIIVISSSSAQLLRGMNYTRQYHGLTDQCAAALNTVVECPGFLHSKALDNSLLDPEELSSLCVDACKNALHTIHQKIQQACSADSDIWVDRGIAYPATFVMDHYMNTFDLACRKDATTGRFCDTEIQERSNSSIDSASYRCSDCELGLLQLQLSSPFGYSNDSAAEFEKTLANCSATGYQVSVPTGYALNGSSTQSMPAAASTPTCKCSYQVQQQDTCHSIAISQNVSSYGLATLNHLDVYCNVLPAPGATLCLPDQCQVATVSEHQTCDQVVQQQSTNITVTQLRAWNPNINYMCSNLGKQLNGTVICVSPPGGFLDYGRPPRSSPPGTASGEASIPSNVAPNTSTRCGKFYTVNAGEYCWLVTMQHGISLGDFYFLNPSIDKECSNLLAGSAYCVKPVGSIATYEGYNGGTQTLATVESRKVATATAADGAAAATETSGQSRDSLPDAPFQLEFGKPLPYFDADGQLVMPSSS